MKKEIDLDRQITNAIKRYKRELESAIYEGADGKFFIGGRVVSKVLNDYYEDFSFYIYHCRMRELDLDKEKSKAQELRLMAIKDFVEGMTDKQYNKIKNYYKKNIIAAKHHNTKF